MARYELESQMIKEYNLYLSEYEADESAEFLYESLVLMYENNLQMQEEIYNNNSEHVETTYDMYVTSEENILMLVDHIELANEESALAVEIGLQEAVNVKNEASMHNQLLLEEFSELLQYTRLGSLENTKVYEFITGPTELVNQSVAPATLTYHIQQTKGIIKPYMIYIGLAILGVIGILCGIHRRRRELGDILDMQ
ncbi:MAG: hypothetical protein R3Y67_10020 [Eubacteriales bacterium]